MAPSTHLPKKAGDLQLWGNIQSTHLAHAMAHAAQQFSGLTIVVALSLIHI